MSSIKMPALTLVRLFAAGRRVQDSRLLRMDFPHDDGPPDTALLVNSLRAHEEMSRDFRFEAELLSDNLHVPLTAMMGRMVTISMVRDDGSLRYFNGYVGEFRLLRSDGGFAFYQMVRYGPVTWEHCLTIRHNHGAVEPRAARGLLREVARPEPLLSCACGQACPVSGVWQPWVAADHPMQAIVNQSWRQAWLTQGAPLPQPRRDWLLDLPDDDVTWHLMEASIADPANA